MCDISIQLQLVLIAIVALYAIFLIKSKLKPKVIRRAAVVILIAGTLLHMYGFSHESYEEGILTTFFRSLIMTVKMFVYDGELIELEEAQRSPFFLEMYFCIFYAAMITSLSAILMMFGKRAVTVVLLAFRKKKFAHVFIGVNPRSEIIARGIEDEDIAFIEFPSDNAGEEELSVKHILKGVSGNEGRVKEKHRRNITILRAKNNLILGEAGDNVFASIGIGRLKKLTDANTAFYILSENTDKNLNELMTILSDKDLVDNTIHVCLARKGVSRHYKTVLKNTGTHFIYPSSLSVVELMKNPICHPASVMNPVFSAEGKPTGSVSGSFDALIIGFGETGQAVTKFLYEFSAAMAGNNDPLPVNITVQDEDIENQKGRFIFGNPELRDSSLINYENTGTKSSAFWSSLISRLDSLNYIAISLSDDDSNLDLACTILTYAMKRRSTGIENFRIVVRKKRTLAPERNLIAKLNEKAGKEVIVCYGEYDRIFTPEMIVSKERHGINSNAIRISKMIENAYVRESGDTLLNSDKPVSPAEKSRQRMEIHQLISRANHIASMEYFTNGIKELTPEAIENFARAEHLRYMRYLCAHGYSYAQKDDDNLKTSHQICDWDSLTETDRQYHRDMAKAQVSTMGQE